MHTVDQTQRHHIYLTPPRPQKTNKPKKQKQKQTSPKYNVTQIRLIKLRVHYIRLRLC